MEKILKKFTEPLIVLNKEIKLNLHAQILLHLLFFFNSERLVCYRFNDIIETDMIAHFNDRIHAFRKSNRNKSTGKIYKQFKHVGKSVYAFCVFLVVGIQYITYA